MFPPPPFFLNPDFTPNIAKRSILKNKIRFDNQQNKQFVS